MTKEEMKDQVIYKYYAEDAMCVSDLFEMLADYDELLEASSNSEYKPPSAQCSHFFRGTDGVHACIVEQCNHPDKEKW